MNERIRSTADQSPQGEKASEAWRPYHDPEQTKPLEEAQEHSSAVREDLSPEMVAEGIRRLIPGVLIAHEIIDETRRKSFERMRERSSVVRKDLDPADVARELRARLPATKRALKVLDRAKQVSYEALHRRMDI